MTSQRPVHLKTLRRVTLYGRETCPPCKRTKKLLDQAGVDFLYVDVDREPEALDGLNDLEWVTALPVVVTPLLKWCGYRPETVRSLIATYGNQH